MRALLRRDLFAFAEPDTRSRRVGEGFRGHDYRVFKTRKSKGADYAQVRLENGKRGWLCTRWRDRLYAIVDKAGTFISEQELADVLALYTGWTYGRDGEHSRYPAALLAGAEENLSGVDEPLHGLGLASGPPNVTKCCPFLEGLLVGAFGGAWDKADRRDFMVMGADKFGPVTAAVRRGFGEVIANASTPGPWTLVQGWNATWTQGHTFLIADTGRHDRVLVLESNRSNRYRLDGPGWRGIGPLGTPVGQWDTQAPVWVTWSELKRRMPNRKACMLRVRNVGHADLDLDQPKNDTVSHLDAGEE